MSKTKQYRTMVATKHRRHHLLLTICHGLQYWISTAKDHLWPWTRNHLSAIAAMLLSVSKKGWDADQKL